MEVICDLSQTESFERIRRKVVGIDVGILVNNVGTSHMPCQFHLADEETLEAIINCNIKTLTLLTRIVLPDMLKK